MNRIIALVVALMLLLSVCAFATEAAPSVTISQVVVPSADVVIAEDFVVKLTVIPEETKEKEVFDEIVAFIAEEPVATYFGEEVMTVAVEYLPEELDTSTLVVDEFFMLTEENYDESYGEVTAAFEFVTPYEEGTVLIAMIGVMPSEDAEEAEITWIPAPAVASEGKVQITFTEEVFAMMQENNCVCALLRAEDFESEEAAVAEITE